MFLVENTKMQRCLRWIVGYKVLAKRIWSLMMYTKDVLYQHYSQVYCSIICKNFSQLPVFNTCAKFVFWRCGVYYNNVIYGWIPVDKLFNVILPK
jgi:hypothetical protein